MAKDENGILWAYDRIPKALLLLYFFNSFLTAFPVIAMSDFLNNVVGMPLYTQSQFYAFIFIPYCLKPLYSLFANSLESHERFRTRSRKVLLQICGTCGGILFLFTLCVRSISGVFTVFFFINVFDSCAELMLGSYLMETAHRDMRNAGAVQALAGSVRAAGSISAALVTLALYPCDSAQAPDCRKILAVTGLLATPNFVLSSLLPDSGTSEALAPLAASDQQSTKVPCAPADQEGAFNNYGPTGGASKRNRGVCGEPEHNTGEGVWLRRVLPGVAFVVLIQILLVWISLEDLISDRYFWSGLALVSTGVLLALVWLTKTTLGSAETRQAAIKYGMPALFLFVYNAAPSADEQLYTYQFYLFYGSAPCKMTHLSLISSAASIVSYILYGLACNRRRIKIVIVTTAAVGILFSLLWLPLASISHDEAGGAADDPVSGVCVSASWLAWTPTKCISPFAYAAVIRFVTGISTVLAFAPATVLATESTPSAHKTTAYAIFLSSIDSGSSASGWITAALVKRLGISYGDWGNMPDLIWIAACSQLAILALVPCLRDTAAAVDRTPQVADPGWSYESVGPTANVDVSCEHHGISYVAMRGDDQTPRDSQTQLG